MNANDWASLIPLALLLVFAYLVLIRPARRRAQEVHSVQSALSMGDEVMLTSGIFGVVTAVGDERLTVQVAPAVEVEVARAAVAKIVRDVPEVSPDSVQQQTASETIGGAEPPAGEAAPDQGYQQEHGQADSTEQPGTRSDYPDQDEPGRGAR